jgi:hypothetical protein
MAGANSNIQITDLDFNNIKNNLKKYLQSQDILKDYNYEGSALSTILDVLAYNTQYNAYYLNMVANEMFLDSALRRSSVVSQAKVLNYTPKSSLAPSATINFKVNQVNDNSLTLPKFTHFLSEAVDGVNYNFVTTDTHTVDVTNRTALFEKIPIKQGIPANLSYTVNSTDNPKYIFSIPEANVDTTTLQVIVQVSSSNSYFDIYNLSTNYLELNGNSLVYFMEESMTGGFQISFGDGILGKKLVDGNVVKMSYIVTQGTSSAGANNFVVMDSISGYSNTTIYPVFPASQGGNKESIDSIKFQAPKSYSAQGRAVTKEDYITLIQQNNLGISFDAVNVWGGQQNDPPVFGQVFIALKPTGGYSLTQTQKQRLIQDVIKPISVMTIEPTIVDPDYTYIQVTANVLYDPKKTTLTASSLTDLIKTSISNFGKNTLNTFNSTFSVSDLISYIQSSSQSIITNEVSIQLQKKFYPNLSNATNYKFYYGAPIKKGNFLSGIGSSPSIQYPSSTTLIDGVFLEELASSTQGVESISVLNPGYGYQTAPTITIYGDGTGATAEATINPNGTIKSIIVTNAGSGYTSAYATLTPATNDTTGKLGAVVVNLEGRYGTIRMYYNDTNNVKTILNSNIGTIDYTNGIITLTSFNPYQVNNDLGQLTITVNPSTTIVSSTYNRIITIDPYDPNAIIVNVTAKSS